MAQRLYVFTHIFQSYGNDRLKQNKTKNRYIQFQKILYISEDQKQNRITKN